MGGRAERIDPVADDVRVQMPPQEDGFGEECFGCVYYSAARTSWRRHISVDIELRFFSQKAIPLDEKYVTLPKSIGWFNNIVIPKTRAMVAGFKGMATRLRTHHTGHTRIRHCSMEVNSIAISKRDLCIVDVM